MGFLSLELVTCPLGERGQASEQNKYQGVGKALILKLLWERKFQLLRVTVKVGLTHFLPAALLGGLNLPLFPLPSLSVCVPSPNLKSGQFLSRQVDFALRDWT